jgi:hypothetical protein
MHDSALGSILETLLETRFDLGQEKLHLFSGIANFWLSDPIQEVLIYKSFCMLDFISTPREPPAYGLWR